MNRILFNDETTNSILRLNFHHFAKMISDYRTVNRCSAKLNLRFRPLIQSAARMLINSRVENSTNIFWLPPIPGFPLHYVRLFTPTNMQYVYDYFATNSKHKLHRPALVQVATVRYVQFSWSSTRVALDITAAWSIVTVYEHVCRGLWATSCLCTYDRTRVTFPTEFL